jgi:type II secretory pathway pseudopilin PulG
MTARGQGGFTYLSILFAVAISAIAVGGLLDLWSVEERRDREVELLFVGNQYRDAIARYYENSPGDDKQYPASPDELLSDARFSPPQRYLRRPYKDPMSAAGRWKFVRSTGGAIMGVYSVAPGTPLKQTNFAPVNDTFKGKNNYADWKFVYDKGLDKHEPAVFHELR